MSDKYKKPFIVFIFAAIILLVCFSDITKQGVARGLVISTNVIIPSLFPFMVCITLILKFGHKFNMGFAFVLSMLGGYPIGAKIISELYNREIINNKTANIMLTYCVNAGPAFIVCVVGDILCSKTLGIVLLIAHLSTSIIIALFCSRKTQKETQYIQKTNIKMRTTSFANMFVESVNDAAKSITSICSFIILFSVIIAYFDYFLSNFPIINNVKCFLEITTSLYATKNIYFISFLLGFAGVSIWCQIFALTGSLKLNIGHFIAGRILHGGISALITKIILSLFKIKIATFSNNASFIKKYTYSNTTLIISMGVMLIVFMIFIYTKNNSGKIIDDVI